MRFLVRLLSVLGGLAVAAAGAATLVGVTWQWVLPGDGTPRPAIDHLKSIVDGQRWSSPPVLLIAGIVLAAGLILLIVAFSAGRRDITLDGPAPGVTVVTSPRALARTVGQRVRAADGVSAATVTASRTFVRVKASTRLSTAADLQPVLRELVTTTIDDLPIARAPRVSVSVTAARGTR